MKAKFGKSQITAFMLLIVFIFLSTATAFADEGNHTVSQAGFQFTTGDGTVEPTLPVDPEQPIYTINPDPDENGNNGVTNNTGLLRIDYVSDFTFESQAIEPGAQQFYAKLISAAAGHTESGRIEVPNFVQVSALRGLGSGWTLSVKQDDYFRVTSGTFKDTEMEGARLTLNNINANAVGINDVEATGF